jgi:hypothetical protein
MSSTITTILRLSTAAFVVWIHQAGIVVWFMVGQGYDRSTATLVIWASLALIPLTAWLMRAGLAELEGSRVKRTGKALLHAAGLLAAGVLVPGWLVVNAASLGSPFAELWWLLGSSSLILGGILFHLKAPTHRRARFALVLLLGCALGLPLWRALVFSIFS